VRFRAGRESFLPPPSIDQIVIPVD
jgi:hypothetical protein